MVKSALKLIKVDKFDKFDKFIADPYIYILSCC